MTARRKGEVPLDSVAPGRRVRLVRFEGGGSGRRHRRENRCSAPRRRRGWFGLGRHCGHGRNGGSLCHRLAELGLTPGVEFEVLQRGGGPMIVAVRGSRLALGHGTAKRMIVEPADDER